MAVDVGSAVGYLDLDISGFLANLKSAQSEADGASKNIATKIGTNLSKVGTSLSSAGKKMTVGVTAPVIGLGTAAIATTANFESAMSKVSAISGATGDDLDKLNAKAQEMGAKTKFSATESAEAFTYMAMAGWKTEDMLEGIEGIMSLAAADGLDLATTSDIVTDALTAFGLSADDSGHFADVLAKAASNANTNVSLLGESFKYAAPVAGALGYSAEDTATALGLMANAGIKGSQGGTALRSSLSRLIKPTDEVAANMERYNLSLTNSDGSMKSLGEVMQMLRNNLGDLSEAEQAQAAAALFGQEAMSGMLAIINASDGDYNKLSSAINDADGAAQEMSEVMLDNFSGQVTLLKSALEGLAIQFGEILMPYVKQFVDWIQKLIQRFQELTPEQKEQVVRYAAIAAAIGPALFMIGKLVSGVGGMITTFGKVPGAISKLSSGITTLTKGSGTAVGSTKGLGAAMKGLGAALGSVPPIVWIIIAIIAILTAAFITLWKTNEEFRDRITAIWNGIKNTFASFFEELTAKINSLGFNFENFGEVLKALWMGLCEFLGPLLIGAFKDIWTGIQSILDIILGIVDFFIALFRGDWEGVWQSIKDIFGAVWKSMVTLLKDNFNLILEQLDIVCGWFGTTWENVWTSIKDFFVGIWQSIVDFFVGVWKSIANFFIVIWQSIANFFVGLWRSIANFFISLWQSIASFFVGLWDGIVNVIQTAWSWIVGILSAVSTWIYDNVIAPVGRFFTNLFNGIKSGVQAVWNWIVNLVRGVVTWVDTNLIQPIANFFTALWRGIVKAYHTVIDPWIEIVRRLAVIFYNEVIAPIAQFFAELWNGIVTSLQNAWNRIVTLAATIATWVNTNVIVPLVTFITDLWTTITTGLQNAWNWIMNLAITIVMWFSVNVIEPLKQFFADLWNSIVTGLQNAWNWLVNFVLAIPTWFNVNVIQPIKQFFIDLWHGIVTGVQSTWTWITNLASTIATWFSNVVVQPVKNFFAGMWDGFKNGARNAWEGVKSIFSSVATFFGNIFKTAWEKVKAVFAAGGKIFDGIKDGIVTAFKTVVNAIIKGINKVIKLPFQGLNGILDKIQNVSIVGVKPFSWVTWRASIPEIPMLASGAVIPANDPFLAVLGDQKHGTNIEAPLSTIQQAVKLVIEGFAQSIIVLQEKALTTLQSIMQVLGIRFNDLVQVLTKIQVQCAPLTGNRTVDLGSFVFGGGDNFDYDKLAARLADILRKAPIKPNVSVEMKDGDVYLDKERVGRSVAPVVARVVVQKQ